MAPSFDPVAEMTDMARAVTRLLGDPTPAPGGVHAIPVDIVETRDALEVTAYFPGMRRQDVTAEVVAGVLVLRAERVLESPQDGKLLHIESPYGRFERRVTVGTGVEAQAAGASWHDGALTVRLPKADALRPHVIPIANWSADAPALNDPDAGAQA